MILTDEPMSKHCSLRAGGLANEFFAPADVDQLSNHLKKNKKTVIFIGLGSNLLIRDNGFDGLVVHTKYLKGLNFDKGTITAEAGTTLAKLSRFAGVNNKHGAEFLSAIPGSVGGALAMNAGAFGSEIWEYVTSVKTINNNGNIQQRSLDDFSTSYRSVKAKHSDEFFVSAEFDFNQVQKNIEARDLLDKRNASQPIGLPSCGSVFKNPKDNFAAKLIEACGLKGFCVGGACVSDKHANFIINQNSATANDIEELIKYIQTTVAEAHGVALEPELVII
ncbi:MAG: UDP-N-acetylmuramate dehydrogenase [Gammaproteobacteria bacterium]